jgi:hypothetical protein
MEVKREEATRRGEERTTGTGGQRFAAPYDHHTCADIGGRNT